MLADGTNTHLYGNDRLAQYQTAMQYFGADGLGSVRQIFDASAIVVGSTRYDPYGNVMSQSGATSAFAFAGEQYDATGLEYLRARYYSVAQGRFTTRDVWAGDPNAPMSYNAWLYAYADAVNLTDPSGRVPIPPFMLTRPAGCPIPWWCAIAAALGLHLRECETPTPTPTPSSTPTLPPIGTPMLPPTPVPTPTNTRIPVPNASAADVTEIARSVVGEAGLPILPPSARPVAGNSKVAISWIWGDMDNYSLALTTLTWVIRNRMDAELNSRVPVFPACRTWAGCARSSDFQGRDAGYDSETGIRSAIAAAANGLLDDRTRGSVFFHDSSEAPGADFQYHLSNLDNMDSAVRAKINPGERGFYFYTIAQWNARLGTPTPAPTP